MNSIIGLDVETSKIPNHYPWKEGFYLSCVSLSLPTGVNKSWLFHHKSIQEVNYKQNFKEIQAFIDLYDVVSAHNAKYDVNVLRKHLTFKKLHCTMVAEYMILYHQKGHLKLADLAPRYGLSAKIDKVKIMWDSGIDTYDVPRDTLLEYCEDDAYKARIIAETQQISIQAMGLSKCFYLSMQWLDMLSAMEVNGIKFDINKAKSIIAKHEKYSKVLETAISKLIYPFTEGHDIKLTSNDELSALLYGGVITRKEKKPVIKTKNIKVKMPYVFTYKDGTTKIKTRWSEHPNTRVIRMVYRNVDYNIKGLQIRPPAKGETAKSTEDRRYWKTDKDTLAQLKTKGRVQKAVIKLLLRKAKVDKVISTFYNPEKQTGLLSKIGTDGRLHTNYNQALTATGRLSSSDPNSQNLPRGGTSPIKTCFIPEFGRIVNADLSQIEWRCPAQLSQDPVMIKEIKAGIDQHIQACTQLMNLPFKSKNDPESKRNRNHAKTFNFRMIYGGTEYGFHRDSNMPRFGLSRWGMVIKAFKRKYAGLVSWWDANIKHVATGNGTLVLPTGRIYKFQLQTDGKYSERQIKNYPVQGIAGADILPLAAVIIWNAVKKLKLTAVPILTVHDSVVFDCPPDEVDTLADICMKVFNNLDKHISQYWGFKWIVPLTGEVECGDNYGQTKRIR